VPYNIVRIRNVISWKYSLGGDDPDTISPRRGANISKVMIGNLRIPFILMNGLFFLLEIVFIKEYHLFSPPNEPLLLIT